MNPLRGLARRMPAPLDGVLEFGAGMVDDTVELLGGLPGDDPMSWDPEHIRRTMPIWRATYGTYFRGEVRGLDNIPDGPSLLVGNHSGGLVIADTFVFACEFYDHFGPERRFHQLAHNLAARNPMLGTLRRYGTLVASHDNAKKAFDLGAPVLVYPGGDWETFRPSWESNQIDLAGRKGFIKLALDAGVPIVPVVAIGGQETALFVTRGETAAKLLGLDRFARVKVAPISIGPPFGVNFLDLPFRFPLPAKITVQVLPPIDVQGAFGEEPDFDVVYEGVTAEMQEALCELSDERTLPLVG